MKSKQKPSKMVVHPASIEMLVEITWNFAHKILWSNKTFSQAELELVKSYIRENYKNIQAKNFRERAIKTNKRICEIVLKEREKYEQIVHPCIWFNNLHLARVIGKGKISTHYKINLINT